MILFWLICTGFVAIALAFVIPPLFDRTANKGPRDDQDPNVMVYRDQISELEADLQNGIISTEQYQHEREEIERRLLEEVSSVKGPAKTTEAASPARGLIYLLALGIPIAAVAIYLQIGQPAAITAQAIPARPAIPAANPPLDSPMTQQSIEANVAALAKRLEQNPGDLQGWMMLGRSYLNLGNYTEASDAFARATKLKENDADLWADYAFAYAMANGQKLQGHPQELIKKSLKLDPENPKALELAGSAAFEAGNYQEAVDYWQRLLPRAPADSELAKTLLERINRAKSLAGAEKK